MWDEHLRQHGNKSKLLHITKSTCLYYVHHIVERERERRQNFPQSDQKRLFQDSYGFGIQVPVGTHSVHSPLVSREEETESYLIRDK